jgi:hypothetical protein
MQEAERWSQYKSQTDGRECAMSQRQGMDDERRLLVITSWTPDDAASRGNLYC